MNPVTPLPICTSASAIVILYPSCTRRSSLYVPMSLPSVSLVWRKGFTPLRNALTIADLQDDGTITRAEADAHRTSYKQHLEENLKRVEQFEPEADMLQGKWKGIVWPANKAEADHNPQTGVDKETLMRVGWASVETPSDFNMHPRLRRHVKHRLTSLEQGMGLDWGTAEALAFGSLLLDGNDVRISGQDVGRGTFSQRHAMLVDQETEKVVVPLNGLSDTKKLELANSSLSEMAVLGFEYGVSWERPDILPIWEAQFGDFFNGSQVIIDTFLSSAETKWLKQSGLVMLLPHGLDGAGPEHSSSRIERMLQLTNDPYDFPEEGDHNNVNMHIVFPTTPAQYFHLLRRQMTRNYRKPLVVAAPKGLLRLPAAASSLSELTQGTRFRPVLSTVEIGGTNKVERVILLSGKLYYDLAKEVAAKGLTDRVALIRLEELCPFPFVELASALEPLRNAQEFIWIQEEPRNQGAWTHVSERLKTTFLSMGLSAKEVHYKGRPASAVPATGVAKRHAAEHAVLLAGAVEGL
ncbi:hypothetical protein FRB95_003174 [Tulasnella sp. JGI-2019a]|nr:hypothetical protein FRB95_003174 [Tulasnella sp. JGI-2019a]